MAPGATPFHLGSKSACWHSYFRSNLLKMSGFAPI